MSNPPRPLPFIVTPSPELAPKIRTEAAQALAPSSASGMEAPSGGETENTGSTEGDSPTAESGDAQTTPRTPPDYGGNE